MEFEQEDKSAVATEYALKLLADNSLKCILSFINRNMVTYRNI